MGEPGSTASSEKSVAESSRKRDGDGEFNESELSMKIKKSRMEAGEEEPGPQSHQVHTQNGGFSSEHKGQNLAGKAAVASIIEAEAAEDKGSRHTMEDAWVVLPVASSNSPGTLRFLMAQVVSPDLLRKCEIIWHNG